MAAALRRVRMPSSPTPPASVTNPQQKDDAEAPELSLSTLCPTQGLLQTLKSPEADNRNGSIPDFSNWLKVMREATVLGLAGSRL